ncbi:MAG: PUR family DNA/RNA-binding protein [Bacteroidaceae bacterium]|nr:PUR family DNA/RNA-binding protein [Bacteroidaceae bacterium]
MEDLKKKSAVELYDKEIVFSQSVKAGKRIYYLDVKKNRKDELFLAITESKKIFNGEGDDAQVSYEKHKIFLYKEDFDKFCRSLNEAVAFIKERQPYEAPAPAEEEPKESAPSYTEKPNEEGELEEPIKIDIDF